MTGSVDAAPRPIVPEDAEPLRALVRGALGATPYLDRALEILAAAERRDPETRALVIERNGAVAALALFGPVAGTSGGWHLVLLLMAPGVAPLEAGRALVEGVVAAARDEGGRLLVAELPADPVIGSSLTVLRKTGFRQEGRIPDYFREKVALLFLRRDL